MNKWIVAEPVSKEVADTFAELNPIILQLLYNRGITDQQDVDVFLGPDWSRDVYSPFAFTTMQRAVDRVFLALENAEPIVDHGDYDADGICGSTVLFSTLQLLSRKMNKDESLLSVFLPHREKDGYGVQPETIERLSEERKMKLLITVDCGISNRPAVLKAKEFGVDTIICDHHQLPLPDDIPHEAIMIHPLSPGETYPNKHLAGTGVAFKLASALIIEAQKRGADLPEGYEKWLLDLVAIATVTDVMPLTGENRVLEKYGLLVLNKTKREGLKQLINVAGSKPPLDTYSIGFQLGPRINAPGRIDHAMRAFELLSEEDPYEASQKAARLNEINKDRQKISEEVYKEVKAQVAQSDYTHMSFAIADHWPVGVAGLVAGKLVSEFGKPAFVLTQVKDHYAGSGRSLHGFDVTKAMKKADHVLLRYGGHPEACGMSCQTQDDAKAFFDIMHQEAITYFSDQAPEPQIDIDTSISFDQINWELVELLEQMKPFGQKNPEPIFLSEKVTIDAMQLVGKEGKHIRFTLSQNGRKHKVIGFRFGEWVHKLSLGDTIDVVYRIGVNEWNGNRSIQLVLVDLKK